MGSDVLLFEGQDGEKVTPDKQKHGRAEAFSDSWKSMSLWLTDTDCSSHAHIFRAFELLWAHGLLLDIIAPVAPFLARVVLFRLVGSVSGCRKVFANLPAGFQTKQRLSNPWSTVPILKFRRGSCCLCAGSVKAVPRGLTQENESYELGSKLALGRVHRDYIWGPSCGGTN